MRNPHTWFPPLIAIFHPQTFLSSPPPILSGTFQSYRYQLLAGVNNVVFQTPDSLEVASVRALNFPVCAPHFRLPHHSTVTPPLRSSVSRPPLAPPIAHRRRLISYSTSLELPTHQSPAAARPFLQRTFTIASRRITCQVKEKKHSPVPPPYLVISAYPADDKAVLEKINLDLQSCACVCMIRLLCCRFLFGPDSVASTKDRGAGGWYRQGRGRRK
ncbi:hypothetical protein BDD12DRAFT_57859 [Trichophaea hybrida]|nr:hypothetical protein BDD12DRAFT_57859 [Trichophaea hybrida]